MDNPVVICSGKRTPMGGLGGDLSDLSAAQLGAAAMKGALQAARLEPNDIDEVYMGCVLQAGQGQAPARQATLLAGLGESTPATTVNKMCGSGMKSTIMGFNHLLHSESDVVICGGMESMSNSPYLVPKARTGLRLGHGKLIDHMFLDGLEDAYDQGRLMGTFAEDCAEKFQFTRENQDQYALESLSRAIAAEKNGHLANEISPVTRISKNGEVLIERDEQPQNARPAKIPTLRPAFKENGTVTAANSSSISDGAAALVLMRQQQALDRGLDFQARIVGYAGHANEPAWFSTAPIPAVKKLLKKIKWDVSDVGLWEINEAFAVVPMAFSREVGLSMDKINISGGACALGHPIGASGARIIVTLINNLKAHKLKRGVAAICIGGGEATAVAIELE